MCGDKISKLEEAFDKNLLAVFLLVREKENPLYTYLHMYLSSSISTICLEWENGKGKK